MGGGEVTEAPPRKGLAASLGLSGAQFATVVATYGYVSFWIAASAGVILYNKWILTVWGFNFPITLTMWHMVFCSAISAILIRTGLVAGVPMTRPLFMSSVVPIGALFSGTLWFGNAAYTYLSVSFIQMLKALMPAAVYACSVAWGVEARKSETIYIMLVITFGIAVASYGELAFVLTGVLFQMGSIATESNRIVLVQILLQSKGIKLNPITSMYYILPTCLCFLTIPWLAIEYPLLRSQDLSAWFDQRGCLIFLSNAAAAFMLNCAVFLLIGKSSALTMNIAGVIKDWLLIYLSWVIFAGPISSLNLIGYGIAFLGVCYYNYAKLKGLNAENAAKKEAPNASVAASEAKAGEEEAAVAALKARFEAEMAALQAKFNSNADLEAAPEPSLAALMGEKDAKSVA